MPTTKNVERLPSGRLKYSGKTYKDLKAGTMNKGGMATRKVKRK